MHKCKATLPIEGAYVCCSLREGHSGDHRDERGKVFGRTVPMTLSVTQAKKFLEARGFLMIPPNRDDSNR